MLLCDIKMDVHDIEEECEIEVTLQIQSRFDINEDNQLAKPCFLSTMLLGSNPVVSQNFVYVNTKDYLFDFLLLFSYKSKFKTACLKGYYRTYHRFERNDDRIKGTINIADHIKNNAGLNNGKVTYSYRENSVNNYLNYLIVNTYLYLKKKYYSLVKIVIDSDIELKQLIDNLKDSIDYTKYSIKTIISKNLNVITHPFYTEYESLRKICLRILRNEGVTIFNSNLREKVEGILFYIPDLWEKYLVKLLVGNEYYLLAQERIKILDKQDTFPDYVFFMDKYRKEPFMILDAKFKEKWSIAIFSNKNHFSDVLDDYDKCIRDMNSICGHSTGVIFPTNDIKAIDPTDYIVHNISKYNSIDKFLTFPIYVPFSNDDYKQWLKTFNESCMNVAKIIKKKIINEKEYRKVIDDYQNRISILRN